MTRQEFAATMARYARLYGATLTTDFLDAWFQELGSAHIAALEHALYYAAQDCYQFPSFGMVLKHLEWNRVGFDPRNP